jgi:uncharacterized protein YgiM (DUF1202 family)
LAIRLDGAGREPFAERFPGLSGYSREMNVITRYAAVSAILLGASGAVGALGFAAASDLFAPSSPQRAVAASSAETNGQTGERPTSSLLGAKPQHVAEGGIDANQKGLWVEVVDAVNMRKGPSSANAVIKVQLAGARLRVASRDGVWVEVVEPKTGDTGWVFGKFVKHIDSISRRADAGETAIR